MPERGTPGDAVLWVAITQVILLAGMGGMALAGWSATPLFGALLVAALVCALALAGLRLRLLRQQKTMLATLERVRQDQFSVRLAGHGDARLDEVATAINAIIGQLEQLQLQTVKSEAVRKRLLSNISHDIRTPLTSIIGYVDALRDDVNVGDDERRAYLGIIAQKAQTLKALIDEIFHLAKLDADELPMQVEVFDLAELLRETLLGFYPEIMRAGLDVSANIPDQRCPVKADRLSIQRALENLIKNAILYGREGKVVGVELLSMPGEARVVVWDRGEGISPEDLPNLFERLYRGDAARHTAARGSGLGLSIARALVEKNGGRIWAESTPGERTSFIIDLRKS